MINLIFNRNLKSYEDLTKKKTIDINMFFLIIIFKKILNIILLMVTLNFYSNGNNILNNTNNLKSKIINDLNFNLIFISK